MRFADSRWGRIIGWIALLVWPALLPHPANVVAGCIWYPVLGLSALFYFLSRIQVDTAERVGTRPIGDSTPSASPASLPWSEESDSEGVPVEASRASRSRLSASSVFLRVRKAVRRRPPPGRRVPARARSSGSRQRPAARPPGPAGRRLGSHRSAGWLPPGTLNDRSIIMGRGRSPAPPHARPLVKVQALPDARQATSVIRNSRAMCSRLPLSATPPAGGQGSRDMSLRQYQLVRVFPDQTA